MARVRRQTKTGTRPSTRTGTSKIPSKAGASGWLGKRPFSFVVYGPSGVGKTSLAANFPGAMFLHDPQETGIEDLVEFGQAPAPVKTLEVDTWKALLATVDKVALKKYPKCQTLILDSLTGIEKLAFHHHCSEYFDDDWSNKGFYSFQQGPKNCAKTDWPALLDLLENVRAAGINVLLIAHSQVKPYANPEGADYDRFTPRLERDIWDATHRWAQAVFFLNETVDLKKEGARAKAKVGTEVRNIYTERQGAFDAKNRMGLDPVINMGASGKEAYQNLKEAMQEAG